MRRRTHSEIFQHVPRPIPELRGLSAVGRRASARAARWPVHSHPSAEIHYVERGLVPILVGETLELARSGDCVVTLPNEPHGSPQGLIGPCSMQWLGLHLPPPGDTWLGLSPAEAADLFGSLRALRVRKIAAPELAPAFAELVSVCTTGHRNAALHARSALLRILITAVYEQPVRRRSVIVREAMRWMEDHVDAAFDSERIAAHLGWSRSRFLVVFRDEVGMPASDWHLELRVLEACRRLSDPAVRITATAHALGFATSQYFATVFRRVTGMSPDVYRRISRRPATGAELAEWVDLSEPLLSPSQLSA